MKKTFFSLILICTVVITISSCQKEKFVEPAPSPGPREHQESDSFWVYSHGAPQGLGPQLMGGPTYSVVFASKSGSYKVWDKDGVPALIRGHLYYGDAMSLPDSMQKKASIQLSMPHLKYVVVKCTADGGPGNITYQLTDF